jgi:mRNA interferase YafQ
LANPIFVSGYQLGYHFILIAKSFFLFTPHPDPLPQGERRIEGKNFWQSINRLRRAGHDLALLKDILTKLVAGERLASKLKDYNFIGNWQSRRECHIRPHWLLICKIDREQNLIIFECSGSHADLFG